MRSPGPPISADASKVEIGKETTYNSGKDHIEDQLNGTVIGSLHTHRLHHYSNENDENYIVSKNIMGYTVVLADRYTDNSGDTTEKENENIIENAYESKALVYYNSTGNECVYGSPIRNICIRRWDDTAVEEFT